MNMIFYKLTYIFSALIMYELIKNITICVYEINNIYALASLSLLFVIVLLIYIHCEKHIM